MGQFAHRNGSDYLFIGASPLTYTNSGGPGYNSLLAEELVKFRFSEELYEYVWYQFAHFDQAQDNPYELVIQEVTPAIPQVIGAQSAIAHETYFQPRQSFCGGNNACDPWRNFLLWSEFLSDLDQTEEIEFEFTGEVIGERNVISKCRVVVDENLISLLENYGWASPYCWRT